MWVRPGQRSNLAQGPSLIHLIYHDSLRIFNCQKELPPEGTSTENMKSRLL